MKKIFFVLAILAMIITGCRSARISSQLTSGEVPCRPRNIIITEETASGISGMHNWIAHCNGKKYVCNYHYGDGVNCTEIIDLQTAKIPNLVDMLKSDLMEVKKKAAKNIVKNKYTDQNIYEVVNDELLKGYLTVSDQDNFQSIDTMAWLCKALGVSDNAKYKETLLKVKTSENHKLAKYAGIAYDMLKSRN